MRIYEINTRVHCRSFDEITDEELQGYVSLGFDAIWLMGVWQISEGVRKFSKITSEDFEGSPYAVPDYKYNRELGGKRGFAALVKRAHKAGLKVLVDFVSNHMALDSPWIDEDPSWFIRSDARVRKQATSDYFLHKSGEVIAFGRDPFFPPWHDTSQLDYSNKALRSRMIKVLKEIAQTADGVRCDMAMLILRDYFHKQWYPLVPEDWFHDRWPEEFWSQAIREVKSERPDFIFIAEAYWDKETQLIEMGFDYAYEKRLYDALVAR
ncbi:MAG TPA: alpha-amylase family glycosyl hydrolase, partial [Blastocatellia bacterium]|nr:alpha-amylase family glycosyl hydrolase [Blastocatellia bacterium]